MATQQPTPMNITQLVEAFTEAYSEAYYVSHDTGLDMQLQRELDRAFIEHLTLLEHHAVVPTVDEALRRLAASRRDHTAWRYWLLAARRFPHPCYTDTYVRLLEDTSYLSPRSLNALMENARICTDERIIFGLSRFLAQPLDVCSGLARDFTLRNLFTLRTPHAHAVLEQHAAGHPYAQVLLRRWRAGNSRYFTFADVA